MANIGKKRTAYPLFLLIFVKMEMLCGKVVLYDKRKQDLSSFLLLLSENSAVQRLIDKLPNRK